MTKDIKLSGAQLYALDLASRYKLQRSSMGWWAVASGGSALSDPVEILAPNTIRSLYRLGRATVGQRPTLPEPMRQSEVVPGLLLRELNQGRRIVGIQMGSSPSPQWEVAK